MSKLIPLLLISLLSTVLCDKIIEATREVELERLSVVETSTSIKFHPENDEETYFYHVIPAEH